MILSIGEILADMTFNNETESFSAFAGGAPFNVAVNAKRAGAVSGFIGKVGNDTIGRFLIAKTKKADLDYLNIQVDGVKNTTLAFVSLTNGERDFSFYRNKTADYYFDLKDISLGALSNLNIVNIGSLMLSDKDGVKTANGLFKMVKKSGAKIAFDINLRMDLYDDFSSAKKVYSPFIKKADIIKFSDDEFALFTDNKSIEDGLAFLGLLNKTVIVTFGAKGSVIAHNGMVKTIPTVPVTPVDTTGAGDAFFGTFLAHMDGKDFTENNLTFAMEQASIKGAEATKFHGAIKL